MEEKVVEAVQPADQSAAPAQPVNYVDAITQAIDAAYETTTDDFGEQTFSERTSERDGTPAAEATEAAPDGAAQQVSQEPATVQPTFDPEQDKLAGIDTLDPVYRAAVARLAAAPVTQDTEDQEPDAKQAARQTEAARDDDTRVTVPVMEVNFDDFEPARLSPESPLAGNEGDIARVAIDAVKRAVSQINKQNQEFAEVQTLKNTQRYLEDVVTAIEERGGPEKKQEALAFMAEFKDLAKSQPVKWANLAVKQLGIDPSTPVQAATPAPESPAQPATAPSTPQADPKKVARQVVNQQTRPATPAAQVPGRNKQFSSYTEAAADAVARALEG